MFEKFMQGRCLYFNLNAENNRKRLEFPNKLFSVSYDYVQSLNFIIISVRFARIHTNSLINIEKIFIRPNTKFYNTEDVNGIAAELQLTKTRPTSFYKKHNLL